MRVSGQNAAHPPQQQQKSGRGSGGERPPTPPPPTNKSSSIRCPPTSIASPAHRTPLPNPLYNNAQPRKHGLARGNAEPLRDPQQDPHARPQQRRRARGRGHFQGWKYWREGDIKGRERHHQGWAPERAREGGEEREEREYRRDTVQGCDDPIGSGVHGSRIRRRQLTSAAFPASAFSATMGRGAIVGEPPRAR